MEQNSTPHDNIHFLEPQTITLPRFDAKGYVLDIGGGGEGVIAQLMGDQVIAIDRSRSELEEAPDVGLKIVMDAAELRFLDNTFETATAFFTLLYMHPQEQCANVLAEVYRVLRPGGQLLVWDVALPAQGPATEEAVAIMLTIDLPTKRIETGYGTRWPQEQRDAAYYQELAQPVGFILVHEEMDRDVFHLVFRKPI